MKHIRFTDGKTYEPSKIIGIGRNYVAHINEMNSERTEEPVIFLKPNSALHDIYKPIPIPQNMGSVHHEIELAVCIGRDGKHIPRADAMDYVEGYGLALDLTLRDVQSAAKQKGLPWALAKGFDRSCPVSEFVYKEQAEQVNNLNLRLMVNGAVRQEGNTKQMLFGIDEIIAYVSRFISLLPRDIILTGTPAGVGPLQNGDTIEASIDNIAQVKTSVIRDK